MAKSKTPVLTPRPKKGQFLKSIASKVKSITTKGGTKK